ncbi:recombinase family protein [Pseudomonas sp. BT-42-2]|uniref:recombinase family protein n=1 Tax=Pseudomonas sp. BT-42-2 TaxID=2986927 RepID=UPI0021F72BFD|nr:recombinase family protein [Pseudomonas sp. BT-42-2]MCV9921986.1 recombinase family protein [Pseudomonas sp. BT-42-2]
MPAAIPYIRFSSDKQKQGSSEERQNQMVVRWLDQHPEYTRSNLKYSDLGKSGFHGHHIREGGNFAKLLAAVEAGAIRSGDVVLVEAIDRTGRLPFLEMLNKVISPILQAGVSIVTLDDNVMYDGKSLEGGQLFLLVAKIQAAYGYSKQLSERVSASYEIRRQKAINGESVKRWTPIWLTVDGVLKETIAPYIKQAFDLYVSGVGKTTIANRLRASGVPELATCSGPTVEAWLRNKSAIGYWNDIPNVYEPVVTPELFMQAQQRKKQAATKPRERTSKHFLVGLVKCGTCSSNYIIHHKGGKPNNMRCGLHHRLKSAGCSNAETIPYQVVHKVYMITAYSSVGKALQAIQLTENDKRKLSLITERDKVTASIQRAVDAMLEADSPEVKVAYRSATERRAAIDEELSILERSDNTVKPRSHTTEAYYDLAAEHDGLFRDDPVKLSAMLKQAGYTITVNEGRTLLVSDYKIPFIYAGTVRKGNQTLGYRLFENNHEFVISPIIPDMPATHKGVEAGAYLASRSNEVVSMKLAVNEVDEED